MGGREGYPAKTNIITSFCCIGTYVDPRLQRILTNLLSVVGDPQHPRQCLLSGVACWIELVQL